MTLGYALRRAPSGLVRASGAGASSALPGEQQPRAALRWTSRGESGVESWGHSRTAGNVTAATGAPRGWGEGQDGGCRAGDTMKHTPANGLDK